MDQQFQNIEELKEITKLGFQKLVHDKPLTSHEASKNLDELIQKISHQGGIDSQQMAWEYISLFAESKYVNRLDHLSGCFLNPIELSSKINELEKDKRVLFLKKDFIWLLFDLYIDVKIKSSLANELFGTTVNRKPSNNIHSEFRKAMGIDKIRYSRNPGKSEAISRKYDQFRNFITGLIHQIWKYSGEDEISENEIWLTIEEMLAGEYRRIEKRLFPMLYGMIVTKKDMETGVFGKPSPMKRDLLFGLISIIIKEKAFLDKEQFDKKFLKGKMLYHGGNYYHYKEDTVKSIIGI